MYTRVLVLWFKPCSCVPFPSVSQSEQAEDTKVEVYAGEALPHLQQSIFVVHVSQTAIQTGTYFNLKNNRCNVNE